ncbi:MAG: dihydropteroate synthase [Chloroflexi bacterium]|nr:dihydropteroate synthase [Chloroflexota bacterium]MDA8188350.1 dihydropteroate synthase [Dehalococcoidales bacterium]
MIVVGERIHIISPKVKAAIEARDTKAIQEMALRQVEAGSHYLDLNIGPSKKSGVEVMGWIVDAVQQVTDLPLSLDTTNAAAMEAGLKACVRPAMVNSASAEQVRLTNMMPLAAKFNAELIALTMTEQGIPGTADGRAAVALDLINAAMEYGISSDKLYLDPLVLPVSADQPGVKETIEAIRVFKQLVEPAPKTIVGLSNVSNGAPNENRGLINRVFMVMCLGAGLDSAIVDPLDYELIEWAKIVEARDASSPRNRILVSLYDSVANMEDFDPSIVDMSDPEQVAIYKTVQILNNQIIYAHSYLKV